LGGVKAMSSPPIRIWPSVGVSRPEIMRSSVVLPQPEGPSRAKNSFCSMSIEILSTAVTPPANRFETLRMEMMGSVMGSSMGGLGGRLQFHGDHRCSERNDNQNG